jgi:predicted RNase H-like HicB family nuclease
MTTSRKGRGPASDAKRSSNGRAAARHYTVVFEAAPKNYAAYVPDLPGCVATGRTRELVERRIREAIAWHIEGLQEAGEAVPAPRAWAEVVAL